MFIYFCSVSLLVQTVIIALLPALNLNTFNIGIKKSDTFTIPKFKFYVFKNFARDKYMQSGLKGDNIAYNKIIS